MLSGILEIKGGLLSDAHSQQDFKDWIDRNGLLDIESGDKSFTWTNRRKGFSNISKKIDRFFWLGDLYSFPFSFECSVLACSGSDHFPILLSFQGDSDNSKSPFRFENMWMKDPNFLTLIET